MSGRRQISVLGLALLLSWTVLLAAEHLHLCPQLFDHQPVLLILLLELGLPLFVYLRDLGRRQGRIPRIPSIDQPLPLLGLLLGAFEGAPGFDVERGLVCFSDNFLAYLCSCAARFRVADNVAI